MLKEKDVYTEKKITVPHKTYIFPKKNKIL